MAAALRRALAQRFAASAARQQAYGMPRRFMQERPAFRPAVPPDVGFMPLADRIRDHLGVSFARINLDGLVPPAPARPQTQPTREREAAAVVGSLTVEEARKVLRATQMEAARAGAGVPRGHRALRRVPVPLLRRRGRGRRALRRARARRVRIRHRARQDRLPQARNDYIIGAPFYKCD